MMDGTHLILSPTIDEDEEEVDHSQYTDPPSQGVSGEQSLLLLSEGIHREDSRCHHIGGSMRALRVGGYTTIRRHIGGVRASLMRYIYI